MDFMNCHSIPEMLATAGWAEQGDDVMYSIAFVALLSGVFCPILMLGQSGWLTLLGLSLLALDVCVAMKVGRPIYRTLRDRWRVPEYLILFPLVPIPACAVGLLNSAALWTIILFGRDLFDP